MESLEDRFWSKVWQCHHRHPCKRCCWPWAASGIAIYNDVNVCFQRKYRPARFVDPRLPSPIGAHRLAYILGKAGGIFLLPGRLASVCHACDYQHCCNYAHLSLGAHADNMRDKRGKTYAVRSAQSIFFPDGRCLRFQRLSLHERLKQEATAAALLPPRQQGGALCQ